MTQGERIKRLRKVLGLTLEKFGDKLGVTKTAISLIENGKNNLTDANAKSICREFNVNESWLRTGEGEMFLDPDDDFIEKIDRIMANEDDARKNLFKALLNVRDEDVITIRNFILETAKLLEDKNEAPYSEPKPVKSPAPQGMAVEEAEAEYIKSRSGSARKMGLPASSTTAGAGNEDSVGNASNQ